MKKKITTLAVLAGVTLALVGCLDSTNTVDGKAELSVPGSTDRCYLLEIDRVNGGGGEEGESYVCVDKAEWDKNYVGEEWVDAKGKKK